MRAFLWGKKMPLPNILEFIGTNVTQAGFKAALEKLLSYLNVEGATKAELNAAVTPKADKTYVDNALSEFQVGATKFYATLAEANADIANIMPKLTTDTVKDLVNVGEVANGGVWYKASSSATSLTKSPYDALKQSKDYIDKSIESQNISYINDDNSKFNFVNRYQYNYDAEYVTNNDPTWNAVPPFSLKKGQTILFSVFTAAHINKEEMGSIVIFDTNGVFKNTIVGIDKGFDTTKRVTSSYTATEDCLIGVQSVHNVSEGYDGLDDYVVLKGGKAKSDNADFKEFENTASVKWFDEEGFLISYFGDNDVGQNLLLAYSKDGINFKEFLKFVPDNLHTIRDPSIIHHKNGWWYVVHTNTPYGQSISSEKFNIIKSRDLIHWYNVARIGFDNVKNWAPEFFVDSDGSVHIIGSINMSSGAEKFQPYIFSALDDDLSSWSDGVKIQGAFNSATTSTSDSWIDGFMFKIGSKYHFIIKDEAVGHRWLSIFTSSSLKTGFDTILKDGSASWGSVSQKVEAPCVMALENGNYRIYADGLPQYQGGLGQFLMYQDFDSSFNPISSDITKITSDSPMRHGTVLRVKGIQKYLSQSEFVAENVSDSAVPTNIESVLEEMREMKKSLIKAGLMKLS